MSQAFVKEQDEQWLHEVLPTINALMFHLTRESNGVRIYERKSYVDAKLNKVVYVMSNGVSYSKDAEGRWYIVG